LFSWKTGKKKTTSIFEKKSLTWGKGFHSLAFAMKKLMLLGVSLLIVGCSKPETKYILDESPVFVADSTFKLSF
jgi:hypothetical protein